MGRGRAGSSDQFQTTQIVSTTGQIGISEYLIRAEGKVRIDTFGAGVTNDILIEVKILGSDWQTLANHVGAQSVSYEVLDWDFIRFSCATYGGAEFTMYATGFFLIKAEVDTSTLNQEVTQLQVLDKLCDLLGQSNDGWYEDGSAVGVVGSDVTVFTSTAVGAGLNRWVNKLEITCSRAGKFTILKGASVIGTGRLTAAINSYPFIFIPAKPFAPGEQVIVKFNQGQGSAADIEVYAHGIEE